MASAPLGDTYYPSCVVNLKIKFDEALHIAAEPDDVKTFSVNDLIKTFQGAEAGRPLAAPLIMEGAQPENGITITRVPKSASVEIPAIRKAGTFKLTFDFRDLPIDPRTVRSVGIEIFMDSVLAREFADGVTQVNPAQGNRSSIMSPAQRGSLLVPSVGNMVMKGLADGWHVAHTSRGSTVTIEGRDLTGMFLNTPITYELVGDCPLDQPIDKVVAWIVDKLPWSEKVQVRAAPATLWPNGKGVPKLAALGELQLTNPRVRQTAKGKKPRVSAGANQDKMNFWDLITRYCYLVGAIPTVTMKFNQGAPDQGYMATIYIQPSTTALDIQRLFRENKIEAGNVLIPFADRNPRNVDNNQFVIRRMIFGRNIEDMQVERKFTGKIPKPVQVISYNPSSKQKGPARLLTATSNNQSFFPELHAGMTSTQRAQALGNTPLVKDAKASGRTGVSPRGNVGKEDVLRIPIPGIIDQSRLQEIANALFTEISKGEMGGSVKTRSLASFGAGNEDPDLLLLRPGDGITLSVEARALDDRAPAVHPLVDQKRLSAHALMQDMVNRLGVDPNLARVIVATMRNLVLELQDTYRVNTVKFDWDVSKGVSIAFDYHNYLETRNNITATPPAPNLQAMKKNLRSAPGPKRGGSR